jgi:hypothetical protein
MYLTIRIKYFHVLVADYKSQIYEYYPCIAA